MRPANTKDTRWVIEREQYYPKKSEALKDLRWKKPQLPHTLENVGRTRTPFGTYRRDTWRLRTFVPNLYKGIKPQTALMTLSRAKEVAKYHPGRRLVKVGKAYFYADER